MTRPRPLHTFKAEFFKALGHPLRIRILEILVAGDRSVLEIQEILGADQPSVSHQLAVLRAKNIVAADKVGSTVRYTGLPAYVSAFTAQSVVLAGMAAAAAHFGREQELYWVAAPLPPEGRCDPAAARDDEPALRDRTRTGPLREHRDLPRDRRSVGASRLRPHAAAGRRQPAPDRAGMPLAVGLVFVSLFVLVSRKKALTQVVGFLMLENGVALLAILGEHRSGFPPLQQVVQSIVLGERSLA